MGQRSASSSIAWLRAARRSSSTLIPVSGATDTAPTVALPSTACLRGELRPDELVDRARVRLALRLLHHLSDEEAEQAFLAAPVLLDLRRVRSENRVDDRLERCYVRNGVLLEVRTRAEPRLGHVGDRVVEGPPRDPLPRVHEPRQLR